MEQIKRRNRFLYNRHGLLRVAWRTILFGLCCIVVLIGVMIAIGPLIAGTGELTQEANLSELPPSLMILFNVSMSAILFGVSVLMVRVFDKRPIAGIGLGFHSRWNVELGAGLILGALFITAVVILQTVCGTVVLSWPGLGAGFLFREFFVYLLLFATVAFLEELLFRGYLLQLFAEGLGKVGAALLLSIPFGIAHVFNEGGTIIGAVATGAAGLLLCLAYFRTRSLWLPIGMHITWNFTMAWIYSLPVSGETLPAPPFRATVSGPDWITGGSFGPEGSLFAFLAILVMFLYILKSRNFDASEDGAAMYPPPEERIERKTVEESMENIQTG